MAPQVDAPPSALGAPAADIIQQFRQLFVNRPDLTQDLKLTRSLDAAAEVLDRIGARHGIATSAAEIRSYVRLLQQDYLADRELSFDQLDRVAAGAGPGGLDVMFAFLGLAPDGKG